MTAAPSPPRRAVSDAPFRTAALGAVVVLGLLLALPLAGLASRVRPRELLERLGDPAVLQALRLSLITSGAATALIVLVGTPAAWVLATRRFPGKRLVESLVDLPMVMPPTVAGFALLLAFGRAGLTGPLLASLGISLPFTTAAVVIAQAFMAAPYYVGSARAGFAGVDPRLLDAAATLRAGEAFTFFRIVLPLARPALLAGLCMSAARALGEFGATIEFAGNLPRTTQTLPLAVYLAMQTDLDTAIVVAVLLLVMALGLLVGLRAAPAGFMGGALGAAARGRATAR